MDFNFFLSVLIMSGGSPVCPADSATVSPSHEASVAAEAQEDDFQKGLNSLFENEQFEIDTSTWNNTKINAGHFNSETWPDTARIPLVDSAQGRYYAHPFKNCITSDFGQRHCLWHYGVDIRLSKGDSVRAALDGIVRVLQFDRHGYGRVVVIRHKNGLETLYGHLSRELVTVNQKVSAGQVIGLGGNTGHSTGSHLHFEMRFFGEPFDPNHIVDFDKYALKSDTLVLTKADFVYLVEQRMAVWHVVRKGDTLGRIARMYHTTVNKLCALNRISGRTVMSVGRKLLVRAAPPPPDDSDLTLSRGQTPKG
jgi:LysM repeat protein